MIKRMVLALALVATAATSSFAADSEKTALVKQYLKVVPVQETVEDALSTVMNPSRSSAGERKVAAFVASMNMKKIEAAMETSLLANFTAAELRAAIAFNATPEGKAIRRKTILLSRDISPALAAEISAAYRAARARERKE